MANTGNGYNQKTGEFVASVDGLYTIYYHALAEKEVVNILYLSFLENNYRNYKKTAKKLACMFVNVSSFI